jgi:hypothetical protein
LSCTKQVAVTLSFAYTLLQFLALLFSFTSTSITSKGQITFKDSGGTVLLNVVLTPGQQAVYDVAGGTANPFSSQRRVGRRFQRRRLQRCDAKPRRGRKLSLPYAPIQR